MKNISKRQHSLDQKRWAAVDPVVFEGSGPGLGSSAENWEPEASAVELGLSYLQNAHSLVNEVLVKFPANEKHVIIITHLNGTSATALHPAVIEQLVH